jgi:hypothetical protein
MAASWTPATPAHRAKWHLVALGNGHARQQARESTESASLNPIANRAQWHLVALGNGHTRQRAWESAESALLNPIANRAKWHLVARVKG